MQCEARLAGPTAMIAPLAASTACSFGSATHSRMTSISVRPTQRWISSSFHHIRPRDTSCGIECAANTASSALRAACMLSK